jgi:uncharacterized membrane protein YcaP (DUF421 family)
MIIMQPWEIHWNDWVRILFGNVPPEFFIELLIRVTFIYILVIFCIRLMGKRMASQLSRNELVAIASLAASIGIPIQSPERGLVPAVIVALLVVAAQRIISGKVIHNERFERRSQGNISILVDDCCIQPGVLEKARISQVEVFARLRAMKVMHLGQVRRLYFEAEGDFTLINHEHPRPGLSVLPEDDPEFRAEQKQRPDVPVCDYCGKDRAGEVCINCGHQSFVAAVE